MLAVIILVTEQVCAHHGSQVLSSEEVKSLPGLSLAIKNCTIHNKMTGAHN